jgi:ABC-type amino acid transport substrate-binding protein
MKILKILKFFSFAICILILSSCSSLLTNSKNTETANNQQTVPERTPLNIGIAITPPFITQMKQGKLAGPEITLLNAFADKYLFKLNFFELTRDELPFALKRGEVDLIASNYTGKEILDAFIQPCGEHFKLGYRIILSTDTAPYINNISQINDKKITVYTVVNSDASDFSGSFFDKAACVSLASEDKCIAKVLEEKGNVMLINSRDTQNILEMSKHKLEPVLGFLGQSSISWGVKTQNSDLLNKVNSFFEEYKQNDTYKNLTKSSAMKLIIRHKE